MRSSYLVLIFFLGGCASTPDSSKEIYISMVDLRDQEKIRISYTNDQSDRVCIASGMWPNQAGKLNLARDRVSLTVDGNSYPIQDFNTGYCPGCAKEVRPSETIEAYLSYEDFNLPENLYAKQKELNYPLKTSTCE